MFTTTTMCLQKVVILIFITFLTILCVSETARYISTERPYVKFYNKKYLAYVNITSRRLHRKDPFYYVDIHLQKLIRLDNNILICAYFSKDLGNNNRQVLLELQYKFCDFMEKDMMLGKPMRQGKMQGPCPYPPDTYDLYNMSIPVENIPKNFPLFKGRISVKVSNIHTKELWGTGYIDMEVKDYTPKPKLQHKNN